MATLIDTNLLLRSVQPEHPLNECALGAISKMLERDEHLVVSIQNIAEFWNTATRPESSNGLGFSTDEARAEVARLESYFVVLHEDAASYAAWKSLVVEYRVSGVQVHDARLVAVMRVNGIGRIATFNARDFARYPGVEIIRPESFL